MTLFPFAIDAPSLTPVKIISEIESESQNNSTETLELALNLRLKPTSAVLVVYKQRNYVRVYSLCTIYMLL